jgi:uroporphyrinogen-III synthase
VEPAVVPRFIAALQAAGAEAVRIPAYTTTSLAGRVDCSSELTLLLEGRVHAVAFSSTAEAQGLVAMLGGAEVVREVVEQRGVILAAHGPYTAAGAGEVLGCAVPCVSRSFASFDGLVAALGEALA